MRPILKRCFLRLDIQVKYSEYMKQKTSRKVEDSLQCDADEFLNIIKMPIDEAYKAIFDGRIIDGKTVITVMYAYNRKHCK